jgi:hypothetical protein
MAFDRVKLTMIQAANGTYSVADATVLWRARQDFALDGTDPSSEDPNMNIPTGQPFRLGPTMRADGGLHRSATLTFVGTRADGTLDDWQPCFASGDTLSQAMVVTDVPTLETLEVDLCCAPQPQIASQFFRAIVVVATAALQVLIAVFTLRIFKHSKEEEELPEPAHTKGR